MASRIAPSTVICTAQTELLGDRMIVRLPAEASAALPSRGQVAATVWLDGHTYSTVVEPDGRRGHWLAIGTGLRDELPLDAGQSVQLRIAAVEDWPEPDVPDDLATALAGAEDVTAIWRDITPMARWEWVRWIKATNNPATRARRVDVGLSKMRSGKRRPCCFDRSSCTDPEVAKSGKLVPPGRAG
ncbi:YdeI/OmpD-associated family protein [Flexivirga caeni]|uniref:DUF1905 domain-containing protein n=1 Tax=Flexivirga caeni TaxID=2294115 RepID=A0A3M9M7T2_9MICO|nr:YdeI/OmpD-associated family protein [Flexivirga caeni]RNI21275.1 DUF1905 domain-containing protein [Flexivirga caeni]